MSKKKKRKKANFPRSNLYNLSASETENPGEAGHPPSVNSRAIAIQPLAEGGDKDSHGRAITLLRKTTPVVFPKVVNVFAPGQPLTCVLAIPAWEAYERCDNGEATVIQSSKRVRGIQLVKAPPLKQQQEERDTRLATLEQVQGLPCAGPAIRLFYGKKCEPNPLKKAA